MRLIAFATWAGRLVGMTIAIIWMGSFVAAVPAQGAAVFCAKVKGAKPAKPITLREAACKGNEADVTADVVAQLGLKGEKGDAGLQGPQGPQGIQGPPGVQGAQGESCTLVDNGDGTYTVGCGGGGMATLTDPAYIPAAYAAADPIQGGTAYSKWWVTQAGGPGTLAGAGVTVGSEWVRCKTCHAWDGRGNRASYADRTGQSTNTATRPDVSTVDLWGTIRAASPTQLFDLIKGAGGRALNSQGNGHPDYSGALSDGEIWSLVKFMREGWVFPDTLYYVAVDGPPVYKDGVGTVIAPTLTFYGVGSDGDAANGDTVFASYCAGCHGADGTSIDIGGLSVGEFVRSKPQEAWHKAKFGNISDSSVATMLPGILTDTGDLADMYRALTNATAYPDIP